MPDVSHLIRDSLPGDMAAVQRIYAGNVRHGTASFEFDPPGLDEMTQRRAAILAHPGPYLIAERDGAIAGFAYAGLYRTRPAWRFTVENTVYVAGDAQRCGIGGALMTALIERCGALGYRQMVAVIGGDNPASIALHQRVGFRVVGVLPGVGHKFGQWLDCTLMQRAL